MAERWRPYHSAGLRYVLREELPEPWRGIVARGAGSARAAWTYLDLPACPDPLAGDEDAPRRALIESMLSAVTLKLGWPEGSVALIPVRDASGERPGVFWRAAQAMGVRHVVCFGQGAALALGLPGAPGADGPCTVEGVLAHVLPGPEDMLPDDREAKRQTWEALRRIRLA